MITEKLLQESLECPIALTELNRQFSLLTDTERNEWISSVGYEKVYALMGVIMNTASGIGGILLSLMRYDFDAEMSMMEMLYNRHQSGPLKMPELPDTFDGFNESAGY